MIHDSILICIISTIHTFTKQRGKAREGEVLAGQMKRLVEFKVKSDSQTNTSHAFALLSGGGVGHMS